MLRRIPIQSTLKISLPRLLIICLLMTMGYQSTSSSTLQAEGIAKPSIPKGKTEACVADSDFMRRNHMDLLRHDRDKTVHDGNRNIKYSLKKCISCHAVEGSDGNVVKATDPKHFCRTCHDYAAVTIDCFQCHASRPSEKMADDKLGKSK